MDNENRLPKIQKNLDLKHTLPTVERSELLINHSNYRLEVQDLCFSNGERRQFRRALGSKKGSVLAVPITDNFEALIIREYCAGNAQYEWALPKGHIEEHETPVKAACRESQEETGYGAKKATYLKSVSLSPGYMTHMTHIVMLEDLYFSPLVGDEPEQLEVCPIDLNSIESLVLRDDVTEARSLFALYYVRSILLNR